MNRKERNIKCRRQSALYKRNEDGIAQPPVQQVSKKPYYRRTRKITTPSLKANYDRVGGRGS